MEHSKPDHSAAPDAQSGRRLDSWKEIASYLNRDVTTVRRWEKREGLPVHRHQHASLGSVYAFAVEVDRWQAERAHPVVRAFPQPALDPGPRLAGRDHELGRLHEHLRRALEGHRQTVFVAGELGMGKTALTRAFASQMSADVRLAVGQCVEQYGKGEPYLPVIDALDRLTRDLRGREITGTADGHARSWLARWSARPHLQSRPRQESGDAPGLSRVPGGLTDAIETFAATTPLVLLLEDLHWSDQATVEFLSRLARRPERARLLVIGTYRATELFESGSPLLRVVTELRVHFQAAEIELGPLTQDAVGDLIAGDRAWKDVPGTAATLRQWSGNPLFLVHFLDHLERTGGITEHDGAWRLNLEQPRTIPNSLRLLIEEHLDRLEPGHRRLLEIASVVGETFAAALVAQAAPEDVTSVERSFEEICRRSDLVKRCEPARGPDGSLASAHYAFVHEFYRQVVYERLPKATSSGLHLQVGSGLEAAYGARAAEVSSELAMHFDRGQDSSRAVDYYSMVAENALSRGADREAQVALSRAAELVVQLHEGDDQDRLERRVGRQLNAVIGRLRQERPWMNAPGGQQIAAGSGEEQLPLVDALICLSSVHAVSGDLMAAKEIGDRAAAIGQHRRLRVFEATAQQAYVRLLAGEFAGSRSLALEALAGAGQPGAGHSGWTRTRCQLMLAWASWYTGRYGDLRQEIDTAASTGDQAAFAAVSVAPLLEWLGERERSLVAFRSARGAKAPVTPGLAWTPDAVHGWLLARRRQFSRGLPLSRASVNALQTMGLESWRPCALLWLAEGLHASDAAADALTTVEEGLDVIRRTGARCWDAELYRVRGDVMMLLASHRSTAVAPDRNRDAAEASFWAAITVARQQDARTLELRATLGLARLLGDAGRHDEAVRALGPVCDQFTAADETPDLSEARTLLGRSP